MSIKPLKLYVGLILLVGHLGSCHLINPDEKATDLKKEHEKTRVKVSIIIQPFVGIPKPAVDFVASKLKEIYAGGVIVNNAIPLPQNAMNHSKSRYRADLLIKYLGTIARSDQVIIGLTNKDISTTKGNISDWGSSALDTPPEIPVLHRLSD